MRKTKKTLAILAIVAMVLTMIPMQVFAADSDSTRLAGGDRIATAIAIADAFGSADTVILAAADQENLVDALAVASLAGKVSPIYLTFKDSLDATVKTKITGKKVYVVGAVTDAVFNEVKAVSPTSEKLAGADRWATNDAINAKLTSPAGTFVVGYNAIPDALSVASFAAANNYAIVLADDAGNVASSKLVGSKTYIVGGASLVNDIAGATRLSGPDRFDTNLAVINGLTFSYDKVYIANGLSLVDALAAAPLAAKANAAILLTDNTSGVDAANVVNAKLTASSQVIALGSAAVVSDAVKATVGFTAPAVLSVSSVSAIDASQFKVVFNSDVDEDTAEDVTNYYVNSTVLAAGTDLAVLQDDKKSVIVTVNSAFVNNLAYSIKVKKNVIEQAADSTKKAAEYLTSFLMSDKIVPAVSTVKASSSTNTRTVTVTFNEPISAATTSVKIDGIAASVTTAPGTIASGDSNKIVVTASQDLAAGTAHTISFYNVTDRATSANSSTSFEPVTSSFTVTSDTAAPTLSSVTAKSESKVVLEFNKAVDTATGTFTVNAVGIAPATFTATGAADADNDKLIVLTIAGLTYSSDARTIYIDVKGVKDKSGNTMVEVKNQVVSLAKDTVKPAYVSTEVATTNTKLFVKFNEDLATNAAVGIGYTLVNAEGVDVSSDILSSRTLKSDKTTQGVGPYLEITTNVLDADTYTLTIPASKVTDNSVAVNGVAATTIPFTVGAISDTATFTATIATIATNTYTVTYSKEILGGNVTGSATNPGYYMLDNTTLPTGTTITLNVAKTIATITLPSGSVVTTKPVTLAVSGVKSKGGGTVTGNSATVAVTDNSKPTLVSAEATAPTSVVLTFSEPVTAAALAVGDYVLTDSQSYTNQSATGVVAAGTKVTLTVPDMGAASQSTMKITILASEISDASAAANAKITDFAIVDKFVSPLALTGVVDGDVTATGINGLDLTPTFTALPDTDLYQYKLYVFLTAGAPAVAKASDLDGYAVVWTGTSLPATGAGNFGSANVLTTSTGAALTAAAHTVYIVTVDNNGNKKVSNSASVTFTNE